MTSARGQSQRKVACTSSVAQKLEHRDRKRTGGAPSDTRAFGFHDDCGGSELRQVPRILGFGVFGIQRNVNGRARDPQEADSRFRAVWKNGDDPVALPDAETCETVANVGQARRQFLEPERFAVEGEKRFDLPHGSGK
jgi:hypothetical protein